MTDKGKRIDTPRFKIGGVEMSVGVVPWCMPDYENNVSPHSVERTQSTMPKLPTIFISHIHSLNSL